MLSVPGIGSGLDVAAIVNSLVQAERSPAESRFRRTESQANAKISALGSIRSAMDQLQTALGKLKSDEVFGQRKTTSSNEDVFKGSATSAAANGTYSIEVLSLAKVHKLNSQTFASASTTVGTGTLSLDLGGQSFDVTIDGSNNTLSGIRDAINNAADNTGIRATIINEAGGSRLVLTGEETGQDNTITVTQSGGDGGLSVFEYDPGVSTNMTELQEALNAQVKVEGFTVSSASNSVTGAIDGMTLDLVKADPGNVYSLTIADDSEALVAAVKGFVDAYNTLATEIDRTTAYSAAADSASPLTGDAMVRSIESRLSGALFGDFSGSGSGFKFLNEIGIELEADGGLTFNESDFKDALAADSESITKMFSASGGIQATFDDIIEEYVGSGLQFDQRKKSLDARLEDVAKQRERLDARMASYETQLRRQFGSLDVFIAQMNTTSSFLSQQLASLNRSS